MSKHYLFVSLLNICQKCNPLILSFSVTCLTMCICVCECTQIGWVRKGWCVITTAAWSLSLRVCWPLFGHIWTCRCVTQDMYFGPYFIICSKLTWSVSFLTIVVSLMFLWGTLCCFLMSKWNVSENALVQKGRIEQSWSLYTPVEKLFSEWLVSLYSILLLLLLLHGNCFLCAPLRDPPPSYPSVLFV